MFIGIDEQIRATRIINHSKSELDKVLVIDKSRWNKYENENNRSPSLC